MLFENEHIRVWTIELPPKGHQPLHEHYHPYLIVPISEGKSVMRWEDGRERQLVDVPGDIKYREASGGPHELFNLEEDTKMHSDPGGDQSRRHVGADHDAPTSRPQPADTAVANVLQGGTTMTD